jgi:hypothetical protein
MKIADHTKPYARVEIHILSHAPGPFFICQLNRFPSENFAAINAFELIRSPTDAPQVKAVHDTCCRHNQWQEDDKANHQERYPYFVHSRFLHELIYLGCLNAPNFL